MDLQRIDLQRLDLQRLNLLLAARTRRAKTQASLVACNRSATHTCKHTHQHCNTSATPSGLKCRQGSKVGVVWSIQQ